MRKKSEVLYVTTGGLFPDSFKQKAIACWMGGGVGGRERETSVNDKGAGHHGNHHSTKSHGAARGEKSHKGAGGGGREDADKQKRGEEVVQKLTGGRIFTSLPPLGHLPPPPAPRLC